MQKNNQEIKSIRDVTQEEDGDQAYRRMVDAAFLFTWIALCIFTYLRCSGPHRSHGDLPIGDQSFVASIFLITFAIFVFYNWIRNRSSLADTWRLIWHSESFHKAMFDFFKNASIPTAMVAFVGRALNFLGQRGIVGAPFWLRESLPPGTTIRVAATVNIALYFICVALLLGAIRNAHLGLVGAAEDYAKKHSLIPEQFCRRSGVSALLASMAFAELLVFVVAFLYGAQGN